MAINNNISKKERIVLVDGINDEQALNLSEQYPFAVFFTNDETTTGSETLHNNIYKGGHRYTKFQNVDKNGVWVDGHKLCLGYNPNTGIIRLYDAFILKSIELTKVGVTRFDESLGQYLEEIPAVNFPKDENGSYIIASNDNKYTLRYKLTYVEDNGEHSNEIDIDQLPETYGYVDLNMTPTFDFADTWKSSLATDIETNDYIRWAASSSYAESINEATDEFPTNHEDFHTTRKVYEAIGNTQYMNNGEKIMSYITISEQSEYDTSAIIANIPINQYVLATSFIVAEKTTSGNIILDNDTIDISLVNSSQYEKKLVCLPNPVNPYDTSVSWTVTGPNPQALPTATVNSRNPLEVTITGNVDGKFTLIATLENAISANQNGSVYNYAHPITKEIELNVVDTTPYYWYIGATRPTGDNITDVKNEVSEQGFHKIIKDDLINHSFEINFNESTSNVGSNGTRNSTSPIIFNPTTPTKYYILLPQLDNLVPNYRIVPVHDLNTSGNGYGIDTWEYNKIGTKQYDNVIYDIYESYNEVNQYSGKLKIVRAN